MCFKMTYILKALLNTPEIVETVYAKVLSLAPGTG